MVTPFNENLPHVCLCMWAVGRLWAPIKFYYSHFLLLFAIELRDLFYLSFNLFFSNARSLAPRDFFFKKKKKKKKIVAF